MGSLLKVAFQTAALWCFKYPAEEWSLTQEGGNMQSNGDYLQERDINRACQTETASTSKLLQTSTKVYTKPKTHCHCCYLKPPLLLWVERGKKKFWFSSVWKREFFHGHGLWIRYYRIHHRIGNPRTWAVFLTGVKVSLGMSTLHNGDLQSAQVAVQTWKLQTHVKTFQRASQKGDHHVFSPFEPYDSQVQKKTISLPSGLQRHMEGSSGRDLSAEFVQWKQKLEFSK